MGINDLNGIKQRKAFSSPPILNVPMMHSKKINNTHCTMNYKSVCELVLCKFSTLSTNIFSSQKKRTAACRSCTTA